MLVKREALAAVEGIREEIDYRIALLRFIVPSRQIDQKPAHWVSAYLVAGEIHRAQLTAHQPAGRRIVCVLGCTKGRDSKDKDHKCGRGQSG
jgi:hypothetical protein